MRQRFRVGDFPFVLVGLSFFLFPLRFLSTAGSGGLRKYRACGSRSRNRGRRLRATVAQLDAPQEALLSFLMGVAAGRPRFTATLDTMLPRLAGCSRQRFIELTQRMVECGLIGLHALGEGGLIIWTIKEIPPGWKPPVLRDGERFYIPGSRRRRAEAS